MRQIRNLLGTLGAGGGLVALLATGCGGTAHGGFSVGAAPKPAYAAPPPAAPAAPPGAPADDELVPDPAAKALFDETIGVAPQALQTSGTPRTVTAVALEHTALKWAAGLAPDNEHLEVVLSEGQRGTLDISIDGGTCLTAVAQGSLGVVEVDLFLTAAGSAEDPGPVLAEDALVGPIAVVGGAGFSCWRAPAGGLNAALHVVMRRGEGLVLVRLFRG